METSPVTPWADPPEKAEEVALRPSALASSRARSGSPINLAWYSLPLAVAVAPLTMSCSPVLPGWARPPWP